MKSILFVLALLLAPALSADMVQLKDGQKAEGKIDSFDDYILKFTPEGGKQILIPWDEVAEIGESEITGASALFEGKLKPDDVQVTTLLEPLDPGKAFGKALFPGLLIHGWGHRYANDNDTFYSLAGAQLFSMLLVAGVVGNELTQDAATTDDKSFSNYFLVGGAVIFAGTWIWYMAFAGSAAKKFNKEKGLALVPHPQGVMLGLRMEYC